MEIKVNEHWQHYKTKGIYKILNIGKLQAKEETGIDMADCVVYQSIEDERVWVRQIDYFLEEIKIDGIKISRFLKCDIKLCHKDFDSWNILKCKLNKRLVFDEQNKVNILAKSRELWWCHVGINIGSEEDGKHSEYERPVVILNKLSPVTYLVVPTTSKFKNQKYRVIAKSSNGKFSYALLDQIKVIDARRLKRKIDVILEDDFNLILKKINTEVLNCEIPLARDFSEPEGTVNTV